MRDLLLLVIHLLVTLAKLLRPGGARAVVAESLVLKHQLIIVNRSRQRAPNLNSLASTARSFPLRPADTSPGQKAPPPNSSQPLLK